MSPCLVYTKAVVAGHGAPPPLVSVQAVTLEHPDCGRDAGPGSRRRCPAANPRHQRPSRALQGRISSLHSLWSMLQAAQAPSWDDRQEPVKFCSAT